MNPVKQKRPGTKCIRKAIKQQLNDLRRNLAHIERLLEHFPVEAYKRRDGFYPEGVLAHTVYGRRDNRRYLKQRAIRFAAKPLGRPKKRTEENRL